MSSDRYSGSMSAKYKGIYQQALKTIETKGLGDEPSTTLTEAEIDSVFPLLEQIAEEAQELHDMIHEGFAPGSRRQRFEGVMLQIVKAVEIGKRKWYELRTDREFPAYKDPTPEKG